jgi:hypothetical protein
MAPQSARRDRKNQGFPPCFTSTLLGDLDPVRELPYGLAAYQLHQEAGQMATSDQVSHQPKNRLRSAGRPQMESGLYLSGLAQASRTFASAASVTHSSVASREFSGKLALRIYEVVAHIPAMGSQTL